MYFFPVGYRDDVYGIDGSAMDILRKEWSVGGKDLSAEAGGEIFDH